MTERPSRAVPRRARALATTLAAFALVATAFLHDADIAHAQTLAQTPSQTPAQSPSSPERSSQSATPPQAQPSNKRGAKSADAPARPAKPTSSSTPAAKPAAAGPAAAGAAKPAAAPSPAAAPAAATAPAQCRALSGVEHDMCAKCDAQGKSGLGLRMCRDGARIAYCAKRALKNDPDCRNEPPPNNQTGG